MQKNIYNHVQGGPCMVLCGGLFYWRRPPNFPKAPKILAYQIESKVLGLPKVFYKGACPSSGIWILERFDQPRIIKW